MKPSYKQHLLVFAAIWSFILVAYFSGTISFSTTASTHVKTNKTALPQKPFIYLIEAESCLPAHLVAPLRDASPCNWDVMILSFREPCERKEYYAPHISYLFDPNTTWASGRNVLFFAALDRRPGYLYYMFLNDDTEVKFNNFTPSEMASSREPFRAFEDWLLDYEPAVGVLDYQRLGASRYFSTRRALCGKNRSLAIPVVCYDALFNAFHYKALPHLLPYGVEYDYISWYHAHKTVMAAGEIKFRGQTLMFTAARAYNFKHRGYPRKYSISRHDMFRRRINETQQLTPSQYRNDSLFQQMMLDPIKYCMTASTICMDAIKHKPIIPYAHFEENGLD